MSTPKSETVIISNHVQRIDTPRHAKVRNVRDRLKLGLIDMNVYTPEVIDAAADSVARDLDLAGDVFAAGTRAERFDDMERNDQ